MKNWFNKLLLLSLPISIISCSVDDGSCGCVPPPGPDEKLIVKLKNSSGDDLLNPDVFGYITNDSLTFYLLTGNNKINLTEPYKTITSFMNIFQKKMDRS